MESEKLTKLIEIIERETGAQVTPASKLDALSCDSLEYLDLLLTIEKEVGIPMERSQNFSIVQDFA